MAEQDLLERAKGEIRERLEELDPLVEERDRLRGALEALEAGESPKGTSPRASRQRGHPTTSRRAGRGERRAQLLELLQSEPGLRPSDAARRMAVNPSQVHSLVRRLEEEGALERCALPERCLDRSAHPRCVLARLVPRSRKPAFERVLGAR